MPTSLLVRVGLGMGGSVALLACSTGGPKARPEGTTQLRAPLQASVGPGPRLSSEANPSGEAKGPSSLGPLVAERPGPSPAGGPPSPAPPSSLPSSTPSASLGPAVQAEPTATPHLVVMASPQALRAFPTREASGAVYDCAFDPPTALATWRVQPSAGSLRWTRFALSAQVEGQAPATAPWHLGPGALGLGEVLGGPAELRLPLRIPILAEAIASAALGQRVRFRLEAEASGAESPPLGPEGQPWFVDGSVEVL